MEGNNQAIFSMIEHMMQIRRVCIATQMFDSEHCKLGLVHTWIFWKTELFLFILAFCPHANCILGH